MNIFTRTLTELKGPTATPARHWRAAWETCASIPALILVWLHLRRLSAVLEEMFNAWRRGDLPPAPQPQPARRDPAPEPSPRTAAPRPNSAPRPRAKRPRRTPAPPKPKAGRIPPPCLAAPATRPRARSPDHNQTRFFQKSSFAVSGDVLPICSTYEPNMLTPGHGVLFNLPYTPPKIREPPCPPT